MNKTEAAIKYEHYETPPWAARAVLDREPLIGDVVDPCTGTGILAEAARRRTNHCVYSIDVFDWGYKNLTKQADFLEFNPHHVAPFTVIMNPPFSKACQFVDHAQRLGAEKIICFQRLAWYETRRRRAWFALNAPDKIYLCGDRATSWRHDIPAAQRDRKPDGKKRSGTPTAHAWFIWTKNSAILTDTTIDTIWKNKGEK